MPALGCLDRDAESAKWAVFGRWRCRRCRREPVDLPDKQKDRKRHDQEIDDGVEEASISNDRRSRRLRSRETLVGLSIQGDEEILEIHSSH